LGAARGALFVTETGLVVGELRRRAADGHEEPDQYASRRLTDDLARTRFLEGAKAFVEEHGQAFADRFGTGPSSHAA
jgi:hypothetical protein